MRSPQQISDDLTRAFARREEMHVSHETIYQSLLVRGRGQLRANVHTHLRTGRVARKPRGHHISREAALPEDAVSVLEFATSGIGSNVVGGNLLSFPDET